MVLNRALTTQWLALHILVSKKLGGSGLCKKIMGGSNSLSTPSLCLCILQLMANTSEYTVYTDYLSFRLKVDLCFLNPTVTYLFALKDYYQKKSDQGRGLRSNTWHSAWRNKTLSIEQPWTPHPTTWKNALLFQYAGVLNGLRVVTPN